MFRFASLLVAVGLFAVVGCQGEAPPEVAEPAATTHDTETKLLQLLSVNADGTVAVTDEAKVAELIGSVWPQAKAELTTLNQRIRSGQLQPFRSNADLQNYTRHQPNYQPLLDATIEANFTPAFSDPKNPKCTMKCMEPGICCCNSFWFLCFGYCDCKP